MTFDPEEEGFSWPREVDLTNAEGDSMRIRPLSFNSAGIADTRNEREQQCYRLYETPIGILTELELNYWRIGGREAVKDFLAAFDTLFQTETESILVSEAHRRLLDVGLPPVVVEVNLGWLIKGSYISFYPDRMHIGKKITTPTRA